MTGGLMAGLWQAQQGSSSLHQIKTAAAAQRDAEGMSMRCRGGDSFQASCRKLELSFTLAEPCSPPAQWVQGLPPSCTGSQLTAGDGESKDPKFSQSQVSHL